MTVNANMEPGTKNDLVDQVGELEEPKPEPKPKAPAKKAAAKKKK